MRDKAGAVTGLKVGLGLWFCLEGLLYLIASCYSGGMPTHAFFIICREGFWQTDGDSMIVRMWHGRVPTSKADAYAQFTNGRAIADYRSVRGNLSVHVLQRSEGDITHFITLTFWDSLESIKSFAGDDVEAAKYYPEDRDYLLEFEPRVVHYEVVGQEP